MSDRKPIMWALEARRTPIQLHDLIVYEAAAAARHPGIRLGMNSHPGCSFVLTNMDAPQCPCRVCYEANRAVLAQPGEVLFRNMMVLCEECGNKRCPHAAYHGEACTGSNESGQPGSDYPAHRSVPVSDETRQK